MSITLKPGKKIRLDFTNCSVGIYSGLARIRGSTHKGVMKIKERKMTLKDILSKSKLLSLSKEQAHYVASLIDLAYNLGAVEAEKGEK